MDRSGESAFTCTALRRSLPASWNLFEASLSPPINPFRPWGDLIPGVTIFAYIAAIWLIAGGAAILRPCRSRGYYLLMLGYAAPLGKVE